MNRIIALTALGLMVGGCANAPLDRAGSLSSYDSLTPSNGVLTHSLVKVAKDDVLTAKTVRIVPTAFSEAATATPLSVKQRNLITNAVDRSLCDGLADRFQIVASAAQADLTIHAVVTHIVPTNASMAGASKVASLAPSFLFPSVPVPVPRIPIGLGSLSLEAEARDPSGGQKAAMIWGRGANSFTSSPRVSADGDAYDLAAAFGADFSKLLVKGDTPFGKMPSLPSARAIGRAFGKGRPPACAVFGKSPGVVGMIGDKVGLPPAWTDKGAAAASSRTDQAVAPVTD